MPLLFLQNFNFIIFKLSWLMGDDNGSGGLGFDFCFGAALHS